jgi:hypothetical protein
MEMIRHYAIAEKLKLMLVTVKIQAVNQRYYIGWLGEDGQAVVNDGSDVVDMAFDMESG